VFIEAAAGRELGHTRKSPPIDLNLNNILNNIMALDIVDDQHVSDTVIGHLQELVSTKYINSDAAAMHIRASALVSRLKALNRNANAATRIHKQATAEARQEMDQTHLGLQNLLYEKRHLEREIEKCRQFA
jgi:THO complex subunit 5